MSKLDGGEEIINDQNSDGGSAGGDQVMTGVDTSLDAIETYMEGIFSQIRSRAE